MANANPSPLIEQVCPDQSNQYTTLVMDTTWECLVTGAEHLMKIDLQNKKKKFKKLVLKRKLLIGNIADVQTALELFKMNKPNSKNKKSFLSKRTKRKLGMEVIVDVEEKEIIEKNRVLDIYRRKLKKVSNKMNKMKLQSLVEMNLSRTNKKLMKKLRILENETTQSSPILEPYNISVSNEGNEITSSISTVEAKLSSLVKFLSDHISSKESSLECPVCYTLPAPPIYRCPNSHIICKSCLPRVAKKCPSCRTRSGRLGPKEIHGQAESNWGELNRLKLHMKELGLM